MKNLQEFLDEKLIINKDHESFNKFDEIMAIIDKLYKDNSYQMVDPTKYFKNSNNLMAMPHDEENKRMVIEAFKDMEMCIIYHTALCYFKLYTQTFNKCMHIINHDKDLLDIILDDWDEWTDNGKRYRRHYTIVEGKEHIVMFINADDVEDTYIFVGMKKIE